jgi:hypothetical protein
MKNILSLIAVAGLAACATTEGYEKILASFVGNPESALIARWGPPDSVYESNGARYLTYNRSHSSYIPGIRPRYSTTCNSGYCTSIPIGGSSGFTLEQRCRTTFEVADGTVTYWRHQGNACRAQG